ncbi:uncharacterized protein PFL1_05858 [Pseudozyma flocculosa PF-1]|uniref:Related to TAF10 - TFIID and SAGA subunit n=2 Tax=Pseudozyma flocculosa TaxID=84751 RepID=A0A5C3F1S4_9BASI|nr:uncharacterized protein PFL1_05858 [Pseudozyma flocculosa PF-1]EPQ26536.1 hypothetical protein PFL1_05858 [Pseudozyma flocculosa PF-1]SPO38473.1 related to TAF10 - TFIID and SAGA subunit [Pseudozyma flocculosa]
MTTPTPTPVTAPITGPQSVSVAPVPAPSPSLIEKYRGATVEDLQVPPAISLPRSTSIANALRTAMDHDYSQIPLVSDRDRKLLGYVELSNLQAHSQSGAAAGSDPVGKIMNRFTTGKGGSNGGTYTVITPDTGLAELEVFLQNHPFAFITDPGRAFVLGVATQEDLSKYVSRRGLDPSRSGAATPTNNHNGAVPESGQAGAEDVAGASVQAPGASASQQPQQPQQQQHTMTRREEEEARKDRTLAEFLRMLDGYTPLIPDEVTDHYLEKVGFECHDVRLKRLLSLAAEKFVSDIAADAFQYARIRTNAGPGGRPRGQAPGAAGAAASGAAGGRDRSRTVLTMDDLSAALGEYGINARRAEYYR